MSLFELFPPNIIDEEESFRITPWADFNVSSMFPFIPIKRPYTSIGDNTVYYIGLPEDAHLLTQSCERILKEAIHAPSRRRKTNPDGTLSALAPPSWTDVDRKLLKQIHLGHKYAQMKLTKTGKCRKGNADIRMAFNFNDLYAVRAHFTFGLRRPNEDEYHIITTSSSEILFFKPKSHKILAVQYYFKSGVFAPHHQQDFECYILAANSSYIISSNTQYLILTVHESLFSFIRCSKKVLDELKGHNSEKLSCLKIKEPKLYVPLEPTTPNTVPRMWYPNMILDIENPVPHEDWTLRSILPTGIDVSDPSNQEDYHYYNELQELATQHLNAC